jgi:hypothetical protein
MTSDEEAENEEERQVFCSGCLQVFSESLVHVIPYFNTSVTAYVTTYRCGECWIPSLEETRARLASTKDEAEIMSAGDFFHRHGVYVMEFMRGDPASDVRKVLLRLIEKLQSEDLTMRIGRDFPSRNQP